MDFRFKPSIVPIKKIKSIQFSVLSPKYILDTSVTKSIYDMNNEKLPSGIFDQNKIYDPVTKKPILGGINDPRMGSIVDPDNPGYFGHIELARPVYHYGFLNIVLDILRCVSFYTSKLIISDADLEKIKGIFKKKKRLKEILKHSKAKICKDTKRLLPQYYKDSLKILVEHYDEELIGNLPPKRPLSPMEAYSILEKISDIDVINLGFDPKYCRPEWLLVSIIPVPPPHVRPAVSMSSTQRCEDDLTHKINDILKSNIALKNSIDRGDQPHIIEQFENLLQYHVATFFDNNISGQKPSQQRSGKPLKTITQRLTGKDGRIRGNLMGKRVDFSARTVITADPNLSIDQVGVPMQIALNLTIPEKVTKYNIEYLQKLVDNGPNIHPGARYITKTDGKKIDLKFSKIRQIIQIGYTVERHIDNDDYVIFNRQPSLHKMSLMGHKVKIQKGSTFRLNLSTCNPYNADFDGDEMNLHVPQSIPARAEIENLMMTNKLIVSSQSNKPVMGIIQDSLLASAKMTYRETLIPKNMFMNILSIIYEKTLNEGHLVIPCLMVNMKKILHSNSDSFEMYWSGKQVFSLILPKNINYNRKSSDAPDNEEDEDFSLSDTRINIINGTLLSGIIDKKSIGTSEGSLIHIIFNDYGPEECKRFMNIIQKIVNHWILNHSFTIGIGDTITDKETSIEIKHVLENIKNKVNNIIEHDTHTDKVKLEKIINNELNGARDEAGRLAQKKLNNTNNFKATVSAGSKGNTLNISQVMSCVGQQNIEGKRVQYGFDKRTLPHYIKNDIGQESRGFIENSYVTGLTPQEFFFHAMAGREGLIDTACKTSSVGYLQRRMVKSLEDVIVCYDKTVRESSGCIIQFLYGEDSIDGTYIETQLFDFDKVLKKLEHIHEETKYDKTHIVEEINQLRMDKMFVDKLNIYRKDVNNYYLPINVNIKRLIDTKTVKALHTNLNESLHEKYNIIKHFNQEFDTNTLFKIHIRLNLSSATLVNLTIYQIKYILNEIREIYLKSIINSGEMCGVLAAQSIGEASTQLCLNTFHQAGVSAKNVNTGIPRFQELINVSKNIKASVMICHPINGIEPETLINKLEYKSFKDYILKTSILSHKEVLAQYPFMKYYEEMDKITNEFDNGLSTFSDMMLVVELDNEMLEKTNCTMQHISNSDTLFKNCIKKQIMLRMNHDNDKTPIMIFNISKYDDNLETEIDQEEIISRLHILQTDILEKIHIQGLKDINKVYIEKSNGIKYIETDGTNLLESFSISEIDHTRTITNNIIEIYNTLGIEAARKVLLDEIRSVISFDGTNINYRHLAMIADIMTYKGIFIPMTRHGINRDIGTGTGSGTLMKSSFEETVDILTEAAAFSNKDIIKGVSENIILGQLGPFGTGYFNILFNQNSIKEYITEPIPEKINQEHTQTQTQEQQIDNINIDIDNDDDLFIPTD